MRKLVSIHIPKTGGTSFYQILTMTGGLVSPSYKRKHIRSFVSRGDWPNCLHDFQLIHGHFTFQEIEGWLKDEDVLIAFLRDPVERVVSNYQFFQAGLRNPERNPEQYEKNYHRLDETLLEYAEKGENRNRMSFFLGDKGLNRCDFTGLLEKFQEDVRWIGQKMNWPSIEAPQLNRSSSPIEIEASQREIIRNWNLEDEELYRDAVAKRKRILEDVGQIKVKR